jgi:hypothetical protein
MRYSCAAPICSLSAVGALAHPRPPEGTAGSAPRVIFCRVTVFSPCRANSSVRSALSAVWMHRHTSRGSLYRTSGSYVWNLYKLTDRICAQRLCSPQETG